MYSLPVSAMDTMNSLRKHEICNYYVSKQISASTEKLQSCICPNGLLKPLVNHVRYENSVH